MSTPRTDEELLAVYEKWSGDDESAGIPENRTDVLAVMRSAAAGRLDDAAAMFSAQSWSCPRTGETGDDAAFRCVRELSALLHGPEPDHAAEAKRWRAVAEGLATHLRVTPHRDPDPRTCLACVALAAYDAAVKGGEA